MEKIIKSAIDIDRAARLIIDSVGLLASHEEATKLIELALMKEQIEVSKRQADLLIELRDIALGNEGNL